MITEQIINDCTAWIAKRVHGTGKQKAIIGISGGKDSTVCAMLCIKALGKENVIGIMLPNGAQKDIKDSLKVVETLGIEHYTLNIENANQAICDEIALQVGPVCEDTKINTPARVRMTMLFALSPMFNALVCNTCNLSEDTVGYATFGGDGFGSFSPISKLTTDEIIAIGDKLAEEFNLDSNLIHKTPIDGLQPLSDEEKLGFTYAEVNAMIRNGKHGPNYDKIAKMYFANKFKTEIVKIPAFDPGFENWITGEHLKLL